MNEYVYCIECKQLCNYLTITHRLCYNCRKKRMYGSYELSLFEAIMIYLFMASLIAIGLHDLFIINTKQMITYSIASILFALLDSILLPFGLKTFDFLILLLIIPIIFIPIDILKTKKRFAKWFNYLLEVY